MRKRFYFLAAILIAGFAVLVVQGEKGKKSNSPAPSIQTKVGYETKTNSEGSVTVEVTPIELSMRKNSSFSISMNTHSVVLDKDLKDISVIVDDKGQKYRVISWDGEEGGHHLKGTLVFPKAASTTKEIKLIIYGIAGIDREFKWNL